MGLPPDWQLILNAFLEDTCVLVAIAYLLTRGRTFSWLFGHRGIRSQIALGVVLGLLGSTEVIFPGERLPYVVHTLMVFFAIMCGGWICGLTSVFVVVFAVLLPSAPIKEFGLFTELPWVFCLAVAVQRYAPSLRSPFQVAILGGVTQAIATVAAGLISAPMSYSVVIKTGLVTGSANGFALFLLLLILNDARTRSESEKNRLEAEQSKSLLVSADLAALRARIRPHFLFNTLTSIAALCEIDPKKAEANVLRLSQLIRRSIEVNTTSLVPLETEMEYIQAFVDIQTVRFDDAIVAEFRIDPVLDQVRLPAFSLQTLIENAYLHAYVTRHERGRIVISARRIQNAVVMAVWDNGVGVEPAKLAEIKSYEDPPHHGLGIADKQLRLTFGDRSRLRFFSRVDGGTLVAFRIPVTSAPKEHELR